MINLAGKTALEIQTAIRNQDRAQIAELIYSLVNFEPHFTVAQIARRRHISPKTIRKLIQAGRIPGAHRVEKDYRVSLTGLRAWDANTALFFEENNGRHLTSG